MATWRPGSCSAALKQAVRIIGALLFLSALESAPVYAPALPRSGGAIVVPLTSFPASLDPIMAVTDEEKDIAFAIYDTLMEFDADGGWRTRLASGYEIQDNGKTWVIKLRGGVTFHDGRPVTTRDVAATLKRLVKHPASPHSAFFLDIKGAMDYRNGKAKDLEGVQVRDSGAVIVTLTAADRKFFARLGMAGAAVVPADTPLQTSPLNPPAGSGPFKLDSVVKDKEIRLKFNPDYFNIRPYLDGIVFRVMNEEVNEGLIEFELGRIGLMSLPFQALWRFEHDARWSDRIIEGPTGSVMFLELSCKGPMSDPRSRRGFSASLDRVSLVEALSNNRAAALWTLNPNDENPDVNSNSIGYLSQAFKGQTLNLVVDPAASDTGMFTAERIEVDLWKRGIRINILGDFNKGLNQAQAALRLWSPRGFSAESEIERWIAMSPDARSSALNSGCADSNGNNGGFPQYILLFSFPRRVVYARGIHDLNIAANGAIDFRNIWLGLETEKTLWREELGP